MIAKFNGIIYLIIFLVHFAAYAFYAFRCLFSTKKFVDQYGMGDGAAIMTRLLEQDQGTGFQDQQLPLSLMDE